MRPMIDLGVRLHGGIGRLLNERFDEACRRASTECLDESVTQSTLVNVTRDNVDIVRSIFHKLTPVVWEIDIWNAAGNQHEAFMDTPIPAIRQSDESLWLLPFAIDVPAEMVPFMAIPRPMLLIGLMLMPIEHIEDGRRSLGVCQILCDQSDDDPDPVPYLRFVSMGYFGEPISNRAQTSLYARMKFLTLPFVECREHQPDRSERRRIYRSGSSRVPTVRVVTLRRREHVALNSRQGENTESVRDRRLYQHQWLVRGHWRRQWYPARSVHEAIWIDPYIKGPDDKPLLTKRPTVYQAVR